MTIWDDREFRCAAEIAMMRWTGTSIVEGAFHVLGEIYAPHDRVGDAPVCHRCGKDH